MRDKGFLAIATDRRFHMVHDNCLYLRFIVLAQLGRQHSDFKAVMDGMHSDLALIVFPETKHFAGVQIGDDILHLVTETGRDNAALVLEAIQPLVQTAVEAKIKGLFSGLQTVNSSINRIATVHPVLQHIQPVDDLQDGAAVLYGVDAIINTGVAGTLSGELSIGDIAVAADVVQHDMDTSPLGDPVGLISGLNIVHMQTNSALADAVVSAIDRLGGKSLRGTIATGDVFVADAAKKAYIRDTFGAIACEMEGGAIGQVCTVNEVPFVIIRAISDGGNEESPMDYPTFVKMAAARSAAVVQAVLAGEI